MPAVLTIGVAEATSGTVNTDRNLAAGNRVSRRPDLSGGSVAARRAAIATATDSDSSRGYIPRRSRCHIFGARRVGVRDFFEGRNPGQILREEIPPSRTEMLLECLFF